MANDNLTCTGSSSTSTCTGSQSQAFGWDARNRMVTAAGAPGVGGDAETYVYDGLSRRQSVGIAAYSSLASYLYDGLNAVSINTANTGTGTKTDSNVIFEGLGLDERFKFSDSASGTTTSLVTDIQGSTVLLKSALATKVAYSYPPFGSTGAPTASYTNPFRYTGREASDNTGLYYYRGRYYSPVLSRFIEEDPLNLAARPNVYAYVLNDPLNNADPLGLDLTPAQQAAVVSAAQDSAWATGA